MAKSKPSVVDESKGPVEAAPPTGHKTAGPASRHGTSGPDSLISDDDLYLFNEGTHVRLYERLGAHPAVRQGQAGTYFAVWAPSAERVTVIGDFNTWDPDAFELRPRANSGIWEGFVPGVGQGALYKYKIFPKSGPPKEKADPFAFRAEVPPNTASVVAELDYEWQDGQWMATRRDRNSLTAPISVYEMDVGSWRRDEEGNPLPYRELAHQLADYLNEKGFTHVEFLPVMEHPFRGSWGYQTTGYFAPSSRYGSPQDFMYLVDYLHRHKIGVILDWVPSHFPADAHGLATFDGTHLFEHEDPRQGYHPDWNSSIFNYGRHEVRGFLTSSAMFWLDRYHVDGIRVDAVASMLYLDYSRKQGEWIPNKYGGRENLEALDFLRRLNSEIYSEYPDVQTYAEESTAWPGVSRPTYTGGLGFGLKWDMGWMHDTLKYFAHDPVHRSYHHTEITFRALYAYTENFILPLS
ncbi:MAG: 1,4-alpha-glucan branching protein GlgB, partial [Actinomycetota bacterium]